MCQPLIWSARQPLIRPRFGKAEAREPQRTVQVHGLDGDALHAAALRVADVLEETVPVLVAAVDESVRLLPTCVEGPLTRSRRLSDERKGLACTVGSLLTVSEDS